MGHIVKFIKLHKYLLEKKLWILKKKKKLLGWPTTTIWPGGGSATSRPAKPNGGGFGHPHFGQLGG
jgi:hypothetical protein